MAKCMPTTIDNMFNPFTQFDKWLDYDLRKGYNTCSLLAYFSNASSDLDEEDYEEETNYAIDRLLTFNPFGLHIKVYDYEADVLIPIANKVYEEAIKIES